MRAERIGRALPLSYALQLTLGAAGFEPATTSLGVDNLVRPARAEFVLTDVDELIAKVLPHGFRRALDSNQRFVHDNPLHPAHAGKLWHPRRDLNPHPSRS